MQNEKMPHAQPAQQFAEAGLKIATYSWHARAVSFSLAKGEFDSGGHESAREPMEKCLTVVVFRIGLIVERRAIRPIVLYPPLSSQLDR